ncbi:MAG: N-acetylmuramoyl-L-alanine amidase [Acidobacteria bacterium]|nr:N-acetylmuramoyl-L-alanine amidase [Acidobacteriota bacterium]
MNSIASTTNAGRTSVALLACLLAGAAVAQARTHRSQDWAEEQFVKAEGERETLNGRAEQARTRREYETVIAAYRRIFTEAPSSTKADPSVFAVAELTSQMGRHFKDDFALYSSVRAYKFLRREYPGSKHRVEALLAIGEIYQNDLGDEADGRVAFEELIRRYPGSDLVKEARAELERSTLGRENADGQKNAREAQSHSPGKAQAIEPDRSAQRRSEAQPTTPPGNEGEKPIRVTGLEYSSTGDYTRVTVQLDEGVEFKSERIDHPDRIFFDLKNARLSSGLAGRSLDIDDHFVKRVRVAQYKPGRARIVVETEGRANYNASLVLNPPRLVIDIHDDESDADSSDPIADAAPIDATAAGKIIAAVDKSSEKEIKLPGVPNAPKKVIVEADDDDASLEPPPESNSSSKRGSLGAQRRPTPELGSRAMRESEPTASGDRSLIRTLGLRIGKIVIDPGHGGHDTGTIGPNGLLEKNLVLDVSRRLGKLLESRLGADVVFTRRDDTFIPLETRTAIANQEQADLFVSVHANSSRDPDARGIETYYLNFTSSPEALEVAARENSASDKSIHELQDLVKKIALKEKIEESREFAADVQESLHSGLAARNSEIRDRGVKKAPFVVLIGANMPSILAEISFISNPADAKRMKSGEYRQRVAESLYQGISRYVNSLGGLKVASKLDRGSGD